MSACSQLLCLQKPYVWAKLNLEWPDEKRRVARSRLDGRYLTSVRELPPRCQLPFFPDLFSGLGFFEESVLSRSAYAGHFDILYGGRYAHGYAAVPRLEEMFTGYLSP